jgi:hypothetical protein
MSKCRTAWRVGLIVVFGMLMVACNLGEQAPAEPTQAGTPPSEFEPAPQDLGIETPTPTLLINIPPTNTPVPELLPAEKLGPVAVDGTEHRSQEPVTVRVQRGKAVANVTCTARLQDTGEDFPLAAPTSTQVDDNTFEDVYTFTPESAGTYAVNCTGIATTATGPRAVNTAGTPFPVEAKG